MAWRLLADAVLLLHLLFVAFALAGGLLVIAIGLSRIYLGVHYPSDVIAGWTTGAAILIVTWMIAGRLRPRTVAAPA